MYELNSKSRPARFYSWVWNKDVKEYKGMCPYSWMYLITIILIVPILLIKLLAYVVTETPLLSKVADYTYNSKVGVKTGEAFDVIASKTFFWDAVGNIAKWIWIAASGFAVIALLIIAGEQLILHPLEFFAIIGVLTVASLSIWGLISLFINTNLWKYISMPFKFFGGMIYSLYTGLCPRIIWK